MTARGRPVGLPALCAIADAGRLGAEGLADGAIALARGGARWVQLRAKRIASGDFHREAARAVEALRPLGVIVTVNDRPDIAWTSGAGGVHLGQDDLPPAFARRLLGEGALIGLSTHSLEQALRAAREPVDYVAVGPIHETASKEAAGEAVGCGLIAALRGALPDVPLVAIGGIGPGNTRSVIAAGAHGVAVIGALYEGGDLSAGASRLLRALAAPPGSPA